MRFTREPVAIVQGLVVPILLALVLLFHLNDTLTGALNVLIVAVGGAVAAAGVGVDKLLPLLGGLAKAVLAVLLAFGMNVPETTQAFVLTVTSILVAFLTRPQVTAKAPPAPALSTSSAAWREE